MMLQPKKKIGPNGIPSIAIKFYDVDILAKDTIGIKFFLVLKTILIYVCKTMNIM